MSISQISAADVGQFLSKRPYSVIHFDAPWNGYRKLLEQNMLQTLPAYCDQVSFGYMDVDENAEYTKSLYLSNVPCCAYFRGNELKVIVIGVNQHIAANIEILMTGKEKPT